MSESYVGEIRMVGFNFAPEGWAPCDGRILAITEYEALFSLIGNTFGGDGQETFALPDLRSRIPIHAGQGPGLTNRVPGEAGGSEQVTLTAQNLPTHDHPLIGSGSAATNEQPQGNVTGQTTTNIYGNLPPFQQLNVRAVVPSGGSQPHDNLQPFLVVNFIISLFGVFPPRS